MIRSKGGLLLLGGLLALALLLAGCGAQQADEEPASSEEGFTCISCHTSRENLVADLEQNPPPKVEKSTESEGEG